MINCETDIIARWLHWPYDRLIFGGWCATYITINQRPYINLPCITFQIPALWTLKPSITALSLYLPCHPLQPLATPWPPLSFTNHPRCLRITYISINMYIIRLQFSLAPFNYYDLGCLSCSVDLNWVYMRVYGRPFHISLSTFIRVGMHRITMGEALGIPSRRHERVYGRANSKLVKRLYC